MAAEGLTTARARRRDEGRELLYLAAERRYVEGSPFDIASLAADNGISRATAYRWVGDNDRLLAEILRRRMRTAFREIESRHSARIGRDRVLAVIGDLLSGLATSHFQAYLANDPIRLLGIVTSGKYPNQRDLVLLVQGLLEEEATRGHLRLSLDAHTLAYAIVRLAEAFVYSDIVAGERPDLDKALVIIGLLLPEL